MERCRWGFPKDWRRVAASTATQYSRNPPPALFEMRVKARPWLTANVLKPLVSDPLVQTTVGPETGQVVEMGSGEMPSVVGPRYCGQSADRPSAWQSESNAAVLQAILEQTPGIRNR